MTVSHVYVANALFANGETNSYLFLEQDYEIVQPPKNSGVTFNHSASNIAQFVEKDSSWQFLRLGYNPVWRAETNSAYCKAACLCQTVYDGICTITQ